jgi:mannose-6-phosphate isomerase-like protein (cupin superfamily)
VRYHLHEDEADDDGSERRLFGAAAGCEQFEQRLLRFDAPGDDRANGEDDEVLFVLEGSGAAIVNGDRLRLEVGTAVYVGRGTTWRVDEAEGLVLLSVLVNDPLPAAATHALLAEDEQEGGTATAGRQFRLLATPDVGCASVTQFVGYIPVGRAPDHFHPYDEVVYVLEGNGALHIDGETQPLTRGSAVHLPARLVHCIENVGPGEMRVLGVFRPAGSPAEAYYPDGTRATY